MEGIGNNIITIYHIPRHVAMQDKENEEESSMLVWNEYEMIKPMMKLFAMQKYVEKTYNIPQYLESKHDETNNNDVKLTAFTAGRNARIMNTFYEQKDSYKGKW